MSSENEQVSPANTVMTLPVVTESLPDHIQPKWSGPKHKPVTSKKKIEDSDEDADQAAGRATCKVRGDRL